MTGYSLQTSDSGHLAGQKEHRDILAKWGNDLRQTFRTLATPAGVSEFDARLLMNHAIPGVNAGYISRHKLLEDHLRAQQQAISNTVFSALGNMTTKDTKIRSWLGPYATRQAIDAAKREERGALRDLTEDTWRGQPLHRFDAHLQVTQDENDLPSA